MSSDDKVAVFIAFIISVSVFAFLTILTVSLFHRSHEGDLENTKRTKARYEMCSTIPDPAARTLCSLNIKIY